MADVKYPDYTPVDEPVSPKPKPKASAPKAEPKAEPKPKMPITESKDPMDNNWNKGFRDISLAKGGSVSSRADGCAQRGKTRGKFV